MWTDCGYALTVAQLTATLLVSEKAWEDGL